MVPLLAYHGERHYPFMAIQVESQDLDRFCAENAEDLARLFTGDYEKESSGWLRSHLEKDLSHRSYERLYIRWTDALAVYSSGISEEDYRLSLLTKANYQLLDQRLQWVRVQWVAILAVVAFVINFIVSLT